LGAAPGGTALWISLWILALGGFAFARRRMLAAAFATVPCAAFLLAALRIVPLYDRFVVWIAPALAIGVALSVDSAVRVGGDAVRRRDLVRLAIAVCAAAAAVRLCADVVIRGRGVVRYERPDSKHRLDDRGAVRWLMAQRRPGDAIVATRLAWPALWWYGGIPIGAGDVAHGTLPDGGAMLLLTAQEGPDCSDRQLRNALQGYRRVLVYVGFPDYPEGFPDLLMRRLEELGARTAYARFAEIGEAEVVDLSGGDGGRALGTPPNGQPRGQHVFSGCIGVQPAIPW
jgi:hypothetical protein